MKFGVGQEVRRTEDRRFLTGRGQYVDDVRFDREAFGFVLRSRLAHAKIVSIDTSEALAASGVLAVLTGQDIAEHGIGFFKPNFMPADFGLDAPGFATERPVLAIDRVRFVGEAVAFVVAETLNEALDAAELIEVELEELPFVNSTIEALNQGQDCVWEECPDNICFEIKAGDLKVADQAFARAEHVVKVNLKNNRVAANPLEPRACIGRYDPADDSYLLYTASQSPHAVRGHLAHDIFGISEGQLRVVSPDVGGGFGLKSDAFPEDALVLWASRVCGRPVRWLHTRSETLVSDFHARDQQVEGELALDASGRILALKAFSVHWLGAYVAPTGAVGPLFSVRYSPGVYDIQNVYIFGKGAFANTSPTHVYRGPGRAEGNYLIERLMDEAAHVLGMTQDEIRRINTVKPDKMPYTTPTGSVYDSGDFLYLMDRCQDLMDWQGYDARQKETRENGFLRGRSVICYIEHAGIFNERMELRFDPSGAIYVVSGLHSHGQGHETTFAQLVSEWLGVRFDSIRFVQGDTDKVAFGRGTYSARSSVLAVKALKSASDAIIAKARARAADLLDRSEDMIEFNDGLFSIKNTNQTISIVDVAKSLFQPVHLDEKFGLGLEAVGVGSSDIPNYPNGCHICEVEIDPETGQVRIDRYGVVDDVGRAINPLICEGQIIGGIAQGLGQAMFEQIVYDDDGQILTGSLMDYTLPRAADFCEIQTELAEIPTLTNPLGVKGVGESGTIGAPPAIANAVNDALRDLGVKNVDMPFTPQSIWQAMQNAKKKSSHQAATKPKVDEEIK